MGQVGKSVSVASIIFTLVLRLTKASAKPLKEDFLYYNIRLKMEREFILRFVPELEDVIQVVWVLVIWPLFLWQVVRNRRTIYDRRWRFMAWIAHTGHFASLLSHFSFSRVYYLSSFISVACIFFYCCSDGKWYRSIEIKWKRIDSSSLWWWRASWNWFRHIVAWLGSVPRFCHFNIIYVGNRVDVLAIIFTHFLCIESWLNLINSVKPL